MSQSKNKSTAVVDVDSLFENALAQGMLSKAGLQTLNGITDIGGEINKGIGIEPGFVKSSELILVTVMPDDSGSIRFAGNTEILRDGHNMIVEAFKESKQKNSVLFHTRYLNGTILNPYRPLDDVELMNSGNYDPDLGTPLYDQTVVLLATVMAKMLQCREDGSQARSISLIITDGADASSTTYKDPKKVAPIVKDLLKTEMAIIAGMGIDDGGRTNFKQIFTDMGILPQFIFTPKNTKSEIRKTCRLFSQSAVKASQSAQGFSQAALGNFAKTTP